MNKERYHSKLLQYIDEVLYYSWDPIGVNDAPEARDEYSSYVFRICSAVLEGKAKEEISDLLTKITTEYMELDPRKARDDEVAGIVLDWDRYLREED